MMGEQHVELESTQNPGQSHRGALTDGARLAGKRQPQVDKWE